LAAGLLVGVVHLLVGLAYPEPIARESLRRKVLDLTADGHPGLLVAGDSRAEYQVIPSVLAATLGVPASAAVNIGTACGEPAATLAAYREFTGRFADGPIMLLSVGLWSVNDHQHEYLGNETLWSLGFADRVRVAPVRSALCSMFLPERVAAARFADWLHGGTRPDPVTGQILARLTPGARARDASVSWLTDRGYIGSTKDVAADHRVLGRTTRGIVESWYIDARVDGVRWRLFESNLDRLLADGVQVVILDTPRHPAVLAALEGTSGAEADGQFHRQLLDISAAKAIPLLSYDAAVFQGRDPDRLFRDAAHLNDAGATLLSERIGRDLRGLIDVGKLRWPQ
jgi:hypothetical protein